MRVMTTRETTYRIGTAGWSYPDWQDLVYAKGEKGPNQLRRLSQWFDCVEVNSSFYRIPDEDSSKSWSQAVSENKNFLFLTKAYRSFTHEQEMRPGDLLTFKRFLDKFMGTERFGMLLFQFPWSFKYTSNARQYLARTLNEFKDYPCAVEVRHDSWWNEAFFDGLREFETTLVNIDQPDLKGNIQLDGTQTTDISYFRFHGRNIEAWWKKEETYYGERYDYLYSQGELQQFHEVIKKSGETAKSTFMIMNNHHRGDAVVNGLELADKLGILKGPVPRGLMKEWHERLKDLPFNEDDPRERQGQMKLF